MALFRKALLGLGLLGACAAEQEGTVDASIPCWLEDGTCVPVEVEAVLVDKCRLCHGDPPDPERFAPMALVRYEDFHETLPGATDPNYVRVGVRIQAARQPMPPVNRPQLTSAQREVLLRWIAAGAPPGP